MFIIQEVDYVTITIEIAVMNIAEMFIIIFGPKRMKDSVLEQYEAQAQEIILG